MAQRGERWSPRGQCGSFCDHPGRDGEGLNQMKMKREHGYKTGEVRIHKLDD